ncbi:MAG: beta-lactamase family protein [Chloroflexi bacterium]|nr:beta-lactamase family protein [Chloroflexota bacterium]
MPAIVNERIAHLIQELVDSGQELGLQVAAYLRGKLVVDTWAGVADEKTGRKVDGDTLFTSWSTTKGWVATCVHILADRKNLGYDEPIARYWPEFAAKGKEKATVQHALTHMTGVPQMPEKATPEMMCDWDAMCRAIASHAPLWAPGTKTGYHAWTYGWILGEIVRRVDGRPIAQFAREEICKPLGIRDFYLGIPDGVEARVATLRHGPKPVDAPEFAPDSANAMAMPSHLTSADVVNRPDIRRASVPGGGGIMNARAIARHYAMLAEGGSLDGVWLLSKGTIDKARTLQTDDVDVVLERRVRKGLGYFLSGPVDVGGVIAMSSKTGAFGHPGLGGSIGFADPESRFAFGLTKTLLTVVTEPTKTTAFVVAQEVRKELGIGG